MMYAFEICKSLPIAVLDGLNADVGERLYWLAIDSFDGGPLERSVVR